MHAVLRFMLDLIKIVVVVVWFFMQTNEKKTQIVNILVREDWLYQLSHPHKINALLTYLIMFCVLSPLLCAKATACYPSLKTTTTCGLIVGFFDLKHVREPLPCPFVCV